MTALEEQPLVDSESPEGRLLDYARSRSLEQRNALVVEHLWLVRRIANRYVYRGEPFEDLVQVGSLGLMGALDRYNPDLGFAFSAFASVTINGEIKRYFREKAWLVRPPRRIQENYLQLAPVVEALSQRYGRRPTTEELADELGFTPAEVVAAQQASNAYRATSIDVPGSDSQSLAETIGAHDLALERSELVVSLQQLFATLSERDREVIRLRFLDDLTQKEIAERVGVSQMHVSRLLRRHSERLRVSDVVGVAS